MSSPPSFLARFGWRVAGALAAAVVAWVIYGRGGVSYPADVTYDGESLPQATKWERDGISAAVYVPPGERMPGASRQVGVIVSSQHENGAGLLRWIQQQSQRGGTKIHHDNMENLERCHVGSAGLVTGVVRSYVSLQSCRTGGSGAACIELDDELEDETLSSCLDQTGCFEELCEERWQAERSNLTRTLTDVIGQ